MRRLLRWAFHFVKLYLFNRFLSRSSSIVFTSFKLIGARLFKLILNIIVWNIHKLGLLVSFGHSLVQIRDLERTTIPIRQLLPNLIIRREELIKLVLELLVLVLQHHNILINRLELLEQLFVFNPPIFRIDFWIFTNPKPVLDLAPFHCDFLFDPLVDVLGTADEFFL